MSCWNYAGNSIPGLADTIMSIRSSRGLEVDGENSFVQDSLLAIGPDSTNVRAFFNP